MLHRLSSQYVSPEILKAGNVSFAKIKQETTAHTRTVLLEENCLIFVLNGYKRLHFDDFSTLVQPGQLFFLKRGLYIMSEFIPEGLSYEALIIFCSDSFLKEFSVKHLSGDRPIHPQPATHLMIPSNPLLDSFKEQYLSYFQQSFAHLEAILSLKLQELFLLLISGQNGAQVIHWLQGIVHGQPLNLEFTMKNYLFQPLTLQELASLSGRSLASFKRDFQHHYHTSPKKWINTQRLLHARMLLQNTTQNISEIADACGYDNVPYFIRSFKGEFGTTPNSWRTKSAIV